MLHLSCPNLVTQLVIEANDAEMWYHSACYPRVSLELGGEFDHRECLKLFAI